MHIWFIEVFNHIYLIKLGNNFFVCKKEKKTKQKLKKKLRIFGLFVSAETAAVAIKVVEAEKKKKSRREHQPS